MDNSSGNIIISSTPEKNPLLISRVIKCILEVLPVQDIKRSRLICHEWNSIAEPILRKKAKIVFTPKFGTSDFLEYYSDSRLTSLPFTAFKFTDDFTSSIKLYSVSDLETFFNKSGKSIKSLELDHILIWKDKDDLHQMETMNINPWIELLPDNMDQLTIGVWDAATRLTFNIENLSRVKCLSLYQCDVIVNSANINRIVPSTISMKCVTFLNESENKLTNVVVNDFVDFSKCSNIELSILWSNTDITFDMSKDVVDAKKVEFQKIEVLNSAFSKMKTDFLRVCYTPPETMKMQMKELNISCCSSLNLTDLPQTIEKLRIECAPDFTGPSDLPNLQYLHLKEPRRGEEGGLRVFEMMYCFKNCSNLVDVHLGAGSEWNGWKIQLDVVCLPRSVKRLKLAGISEIVFLGDRHPINVDVLSLDASINSASVEMFVEKIVPKILVKIVSFNMDSDWPGHEETEDFISFVRKNTHLEKIIIDTWDGLTNSSSSGKNNFLQFVVKESQCYEFNNQIAKPISKEEFQKYYDINCMNNAE